MSARYWVERNLYQKVKNPIKKTSTLATFGIKHVNSLKISPFPAGIHPENFGAFPGRGDSGRRLRWVLQECGGRVEKHGVVTKWNPGHGRWNWRNTWQFHHVIGCYGSAKDGHGKSGRDHLAQEEEIVFFLNEDPLFGCWFSSGAVSSKRSTVQVEEERHVALLLDVRVTEESQNLSEWFSSAIRKHVLCFLGVCRLLCFRFVLICNLTLPPQNALEMVFLVRSWWMPHRLPMRINMSSEWQRF